MKQKEEKRKELILISQCPVCKYVKILFPNGFIKYQSSIVTFEKLPKEYCIVHKFYKK
jgi:hypothetical protein